MDLIPFTTTLWVWSSSFLLTEQYFCHDQLVFSRRMLCETIANTLLTFKHLKSTAFPSCTKWVILSYKEIRLVKNDLPFINSCWLGFITWLPCRCCVMTLKMIYSETSRSDWQVYNSLNPTLCPSCMWVSHSPSSCNWDLLS